MGCRDFCISVRGIEPLTSKREAFFERSGWKLRSRARSGRLRRGSNPLRRAKKRDTRTGIPLFAFPPKGFESCPHMPGHVHSPVRTLANTIIPFRVSRKRKGMQANPLRRAIVGDHSARLEKGNCKKADAFFSSVLRVSSSPNRTRVAGLRFGTGIFSVKLRRVVADFVSFAAAFSFSKPTPPLIHFVAPPFKIKAARSLRASPTTSALRCAGF